MRIYLKIVAIWSKNSQFFWEKNLFFMCKPQLHNLQNKFASFFVKSLHFYFFWKTIRISIELLKFLGKIVVFFEENILESRIIFIKMRPSKITGERRGFWMDLNKLESESPISINKNPEKCGKFLPILRQELKIYFINFK